MIQCIDSKVEIRGNRTEIVTEACFILQSIKNALTNSCGIKEAEDDMGFIVTYYNKTVDELMEHIVDGTLKAMFREKQTEDKQRICDLLLPVLQATHNLNDLISLRYDAGKECVIAAFPGGEKQANVALDSGTNMIRDIILQIV